VSKRKRIKQRSEAGWLGKDLTRRSRGKCELCEAQDQNRPFELAPFPEDPELERTLLACGRCRGWLERGKIDPVQAHFLSSAVWSEEPAVQLAAARLLLVNDGMGDPWVRDTLEAIGFDPTSMELSG
jgi:hypothetical protein